jgi:hypothetical protein
MKDILRNPSIQYSKEVYPDSKERARLRSLKDRTLKHFLLDDNQIYRKAETVRGIEYNQRYAACTYDSFDLITRTHRGLHHAGKSNITYYMILCLVRFYLDQRSGNAQVVVANQGETQCIGYISMAETTKGIRLEYRT